MEMSPMRDKRQTREGRGTQRWIVERRVSQKVQFFSNPHSSCSPCSSNLSADYDIKKRRGCESQHFPLLSCSLSPWPPSHRSFPSPLSTFSYSSNGGGKGDWRRINTLEGYTRYSPSCLLTPVEARVIYGKLIIRVSLETLSLVKWPIFNHHKIEF